MLVVSTATRLGGLAGLNVGTYSGEISSSVSAGVCTSMIDVFGLSRKPLRIPFFCLITCGLPKAPFAETHGAADSPFSRAVPAICTVKAMGVPHQHGTDKTRHSSYGGRRSVHTSCRSHTGIRALSQQRPRSIDARRMLQMFQHLQHESFAQPPLQGCLLRELPLNSPRSVILVLSVPAGSQSLQRTDSRLPLD